MRGPKFNAQITFKSKREGLRRALESLLKEVGLSQLRVEVEREGKGGEPASSSTVMNADLNPPLSGPKETHGPTFLLEGPKSLRLLQPGTLEPQVDDVGGGEQGKMNLPLLTPAVPTGTRLHL